MFERLILGEDWIPQEDLTLFLPNIFLFNLSGMVVHLGLLNNKK